MTMIMKTVTFPIPSPGTKNIYVVLPSQYIDEDFDALLGYARAKVTQEERLGQSHSMVVVKANWSGLQTICAMVADWDRTRVYDTHKAYILGTNPWMTAQDYTA